MVNAHASGEPTEQAPSPASQITASQVPADARDVLLSITRATAIGPDIGALLQSIVESALAVVHPAQKCVLHLLDGARNVLIPSYCSQPWPVGHEHSGMPAGVGIAGRALETDRPIYVPDAALHPEFVPLQSNDDLRSLVVAPLSFGRVRLGTLSLSSASVDAFGTRDREYIDILAAQAAIAIHQTRLVRQAQDEQARSDAIIERMSDGLLILAPDGTVRRSNQALDRLLGSADPTARLCGAEERPPEVALVVDCRAQTIGDYCAEVRAVDGRTIALEVRPSPQTVGQDRVFVLRDVSADREALERRAFFISQISHELRTPLQHILSSVSLINDIPTLSQEDRQRYLRHIEDETYHLGKLVDDLVALTRIEAGHFEVYSESVKVDELLASVTDRLEPRAETKQLEICVSCLVQPVWAYTDPLRLEQVLLNVLSNACKYTPSNSCIQIVVAADDQSVNVQVTDQGPGIPEDATRLIFDPFFRLAQNAHVPGMGLGLYISEQIMQVLGGGISVASSPGAGSTFTISFPRRLDLVRTR
jgi:signal transduction histidine kinase